MSYRAYLRDVLSPLGVYDLSAPFNGGELTAQGAALDGAEEALDEVSRESNLATAESWGLEEIAGLLSHRPAATDPRSMARALAARLRRGMPRGGDRDGGDGAHHLPRHPRRPR